jgi:hypothetical protein
MTQSRARKKGFIDVLASPWTILPIDAGLSVLIVAWAVGSRIQWAVFLCAGFVLFGLGSLLTQWIFGASSLDPAVAQLRRELVNSLESIDALKAQPPALEAEVASTPAPAER